MNSSRYKKLQGPKCFNGTLKITDFKENDLKPNFSIFVSFSCLKFEWRCTQKYYCIWRAFSLGMYPSWEKVSRESRLFGTPCPVKPRFQVKVQLLLCTSSKPEEPGSFFQWTIKRKRELHGSSTSFSKVIVNKFANFF